MKTRFNFAAFDPCGRTMTVREGDIIPLGWFISVGGSAPVEVTEPTVVVGTTIDRSGGDGDGEVLERHLSVQTTAQAAAVAAVAAKAVAAVEAAEYATWAAAVKAKAVREASAKAAAAAAAVTAKAESDRIAAATQLVRAEFLRCGWTSAPRARLVSGGPNTSHVPVDGEMYLYRRDVVEEGYSLRDQGSSFFINTGYSNSETVVATHPAYAAAISAALAAEGDLLTAVRLSMGDIVTPIAPPPPTQEEILARQAAELAANKAANAARRQARQDAETAELAAKKAARLKRYSAPAESPDAPAPAALISMVNLNDPWDHSQR